ncbi:MAG TPA: hypothetical protein VMJ34_05640 [Bryobacteraceae bacterium]|nr:hypothetical protein [Bryobacteraceae bacterium]
MRFNDNRNSPIRMPWLSMAATVLLAAGILGALRPKLLRRAGSHPAPVPALRATPERGSVRISWPAETGAELSIEDGGRWRHVELDATARTAGEYLYRPASSEVLVRMGTQSVRVMGLTPAPTEVASAAPADEQSADRAIAPEPTAVERKAPQVLPRALHGIRGTVRVDVQVAVGRDGSVKSAELVMPARSPYFNRLSLEAARGSVYPTSSGGTTETLRYEYSRRGVKVSSPAGQ